MIMHNFKNRPETSHQKLHIRNFISFTCATLRQPSRVIIVIVIVLRSNRGTRRIFDLTLVIGTKGRPFDFTRTAGFDKQLAS